MKGAVGMGELHIIDHPLVQHKITLLRDKNTGTKEFRELVSEIAMFICYEATRDLPLKEIELETPLAVAKTKIISGRKLAFVPILRAGLGMVEGVTTLVPAAKIGHIGIFRDPSTHQPVQYYVKMPEDICERDVIVVDPPRRGLDEKSIEYIKRFNPEKIGYVSCNSATMARDLKLLLDKYEIINIVPVDLFPHTSHTESIAILKLKEY